MKNSIHLKYLIVNESDHTISIYTDNEVIETTAEHPFYTKEGWKDAADLQVGDIILGKDNKEIEISDTKFNYEPKKVFNFEVANWHTYFVGLLAWLVHNAAVCLSLPFKYASKYGLKSYKELKKLVKGTGLEVHHLIEKRFAGVWIPPKVKNDMLSIALTKEEHQKRLNGILMFRTLKNQK